MNTLRRCKQPRVSATLTLVLAVTAFVPTPARAVATWFASAEGTLQVTGPSADLLIFQDPSVDVQVDNSPGAFPSFINNDGNADWDPTTRTLTVTATGNAAAFSTGLPEPTFASGATRVLGTIGVVNPTPFGLFLDIEVFGGFAFSGFRDPAAPERAETFVAIGIGGNRLDGVPDDNLLLVREDTGGFFPGPGYDLVTSTEIFGTPSTFSVSIPPSDTEISPGVIDRRVWSLGLFMQAGGSAVAVGPGGSLIVSELPPGPDVLEPPVPEPALAAAALFGLAAIRRRPHR